MNDPSLFSASSPPVAQLCHLIKSTEACYLSAAQPDSSCPGTCLPLTFPYFNPAQPGLYCLLNIVFPHVVACVSALCSLYNTWLRLPTMELVIATYQISSTGFTLETYCLGPLTVPESGLWYTIPPFSSPC